MEQQRGLPLSDEAIAEARQRARVIQALRAVLAVLMAVVIAFGILRGATEAIRLWWVVVLAGAGFFALVVAVDVLTPRRKLSTIAAILLGSFIGVLATVVLSFVVSVMVQTYVDLPVGDPALQQIERGTLMATVIVGLGLCYLGITTVLQTQDDFRLVIPYVEFSKRFRGTRPLLMDTSALVDARIIALVDTGLIQSPLIVPTFVIGELQALADSTNRLKRAKGRRGLDTVAKLQRTTDVTIDPATALAGGVDQALVDLAAALPAAIMTTDAGLASVAAIHSVQTINLNTLAAAMRPTAVAGTTGLVELIKPGEHTGQGVGYLQDGTMVVVEGAAEQIGQEVEVIFRNTVDTAAGTLVFAQLVDEEGEISGEAIELQRPADEQLRHTEESSIDIDGLRASAIRPTRVPPPASDVESAASRRGSPRNPRRS